MLEYSEATQGQPRAVSCVDPSAGSGSLMFSSRLRQSAGRNRLAVALDRRRPAGLPIVDLTLSNPTRAGFSYPPDVLEPLAQPRALCYEPAAIRSALGTTGGCRTIFVRRGTAVPSNRIVLTASTSEAYSLSVQVTVRSRRRRSCAAAKLSAGRAPDRAGRRFTGSLQSRVSRSVGGRRSCAARKVVCARPESGYAPSS